MAPGIETLRPGDLMFGPIGRIVPGMFPVGAGQLLLAPAEMRRTRRIWFDLRHVAVVTQARGAVRPYRDPPRIVQAMPSGAEEIEIGAEHWTSDYLYVRPRYEYHDQAEMVATRAYSYVGTPYSFVDYVALALHRATDGQRYKSLAERSWLDRYVASSGRMICSQLADRALTDAGWHCFSDGRLPQDVMPAELACRLLSMRGEHICPGDGQWMSNEVWPVCCRS